MLIQKQFWKYKFAGQLRNWDSPIIVNASMFVLTILGNIKEKKLNFSQVSVSVLWEMVNYEEARVGLINTNKYITIQIKRGCKKYD